MYVGERNLCSSVSCGLHTAHSSLTLSVCVSVCCCSRVASNVADTGYINLPNVQVKCDGDGTAGTSGSK